MPQVMKLSCYLLQLLYLGILFTNLLPVILSSDLLQSRLKTIYKDSKTHQESKIPACLYFDPCR